jgi:predicted lipoprotein with Yx(FWY)xxD motif
MQVAPVAVLAAISVGAALAAPSTGTPTIKVSSDNTLGTTILVSSKGLTLYHFAPEAKGTIKCTGACSIIWPPLVVAAGVRPIPGAGVTASMLGTVKRPDGRTQVTYNGLPLYRDSYDRKAGLHYGQGQDGVWYAVTPAGKVTKARESTPAAAPAATPTTTTGVQPPGTWNAPAGCPDLPGGADGQPGYQDPQMPWCKAFE